MRFKCSLDESHKQEYFFAIRGNSIIKVGQFPLSADQDLPQASKYSSILGKQYYTELKRAIGLHAHDVGIGSFVYLRRIIEKLVFESGYDAYTIRAGNRDAIVFLNYPMPIKWLPYEAND